MHRAQAKESADIKCKKEVDVSYVIRLLHESHTRALRAKDDLIGTQHLLMGLLRTYSTEIANYFNRCFVDQELVADALKLTRPPPNDRVRVRLISRLQLRWPPFSAMTHSALLLVGEAPAQNSFAVTSLAQAVINHSVKLARDLQHDFVNSVHVLRAIMETKGSVAEQILSRVFSGSDPLLRFLTELLTPAAVVEQTVNPKNLLEHLRKHVVGQETALKRIASAVALHTASAGARHKQKLNLLLLGPTGVGKTFTIEKLAQHLHVKIGFLSCAATTAPGYVGGDIESALWDLYTKSNKDVELTERGIVFLDEFDKLAISNQAVERESKMAIGVQQALLRVVEADKVMVSPHGAVRTGAEESVTLRTDKILFIGSGAFTGLDKVCRRRRREYDLWSNAFASIEEEDLIEYGFLPELIARFGFLVEFESLAKASLIKILNLQEDSPLLLYKTYFELNKVNLEIDELTKGYLAEEALRRKLGARPLRSLLFQLLEADVFDPLAGRTLLLTEDIARDRISGSKARNGEPRFKLSAETLVSLRGKEVPEAVLTKLESLKEKEFWAQEGFIYDLRRSLGLRDMERWQDLILSHARLGKLEKETP
jgi:ATP-dependent Clp protease ATP-binding subunit ClpX